jgi:alkylation response protein AidB-like acyl-CoA dehydrogenase
MDFAIPEHMQRFLRELDQFVEREIKPLEDAHPELFDHRREWARTDWENGGVPRREWEELMAEARRRADRAGFYRYSLPRELGGSDGTNLDMALIREHLTTRGPGLHYEFQVEFSVVGNFPIVHILHAYGTPDQKALIEPMIQGEVRTAFGLTEPGHGSDATWLETTAIRDGDEWVINGAKRFNSGMHHATHDLVFARTSGRPGEAKGITAFLVPRDTPGLEVPFYWWTFNMPSDHAEVVLRNVRVPNSAIVLAEGEGLRVAQHFVHENRIRQAASAVGIAQFCINEAVAYAKERKTWGVPLAQRQAIQWPLAELHTECELVRNLVHKTAWLMDQKDFMEVSDKVAMANYRANRLACEAADRAMQVHGGIGYTRHKPFEYIYRHFRRYRITEGSEEIQIRRVAGVLFGYIGGDRG